MIFYTFQGALMVRIRDTLCKSIISVFLSHMRFSEYWPSKLRWHSLRLWNILQLCSAVWPSCLYCRGECICVDSCMNLSKFILTKYEMLRVYNSME